MPTRTREEVTHTTDEKQHRAKRQRTAGSADALDFLLRMLIEMCAEGNVAAVKKILSYGNVNAGEFTGTTALFEAAQCGHQEIVQLLLAHPDVDVNTVVDGGISPLSVASFFRKASVVRLLLDHPGVDANIADDDGNTPLSEACFGGCESVVRMLLAHPGVDANKTTNDGCTPLSIVCRGLGMSNRERLSIVRLLLAHPGIDLNKPNKKGHTPYDFALSFHFRRPERETEREIAAMLHRAGARATGAVVAHWED